jgi:hypothetical protein
LHLRRRKPLSRRFRGSVAPVAWCQNVRQADLKGRLGGRSGCNRTTASLYTSAVPFLLDSLNTDRIGAAFSLPFPRRTSAAQQRKTDIGKPNGTVSRAGRFPVSNDPQRRRTGDGIGVGFTLPSQFPVFRFRFAVPDISAPRVRPSHPCFLRCGGGGVPPCAGCRSLTDRPHKHRSEASDSRSRRLHTPTLSPLRRLHK